MDPLSDLLRVVGVDDALFYAVEAAEAIRALDDEKLDRAA